MKNFNMVFYQRANWIKLFGTLYKPSCCVVMGFQDDMPKFGEISDILVLGEDVSFILYKYTTLFFDEHFHAYVVEKSTSNKTIIHVHDLLSFMPLHFRNVKGLTVTGQKAIVLKSHVSYG